METSNRYEQILDSHSVATEGLSSALACASRRTRSMSSIISAKQQVRRDVAAGVLAPLIVGYVLWILRRAKQLRLKRLYFLSRDGQLLLEVGRRLVPKMNMECELRYLYASRAAWHLPAVTRIDADALSWLCSFFESPSFSTRSVLSRISIEPEEIDSHLKSIGLTEESWPRKLTLSECDALQQLLRQNSSLHQLIVQRASEKRAVVLKYLKQEGLLDPIEWGLVDVGWFGNLQNSLVKMLGSERRTPVRGLYFGLRGHSIDERFGKREAYFFDERLGFGLSSVDKFHRYGLVRLLEAFLRADHGTVIGFRDDNGVVRPIFTEKRNRELLDWGFPLLSETIGCVADNLCLDASSISVDKDVREPLLEVIEAFWLKPSISEARAFADFPYEMGFGSDSYAVHLTERYGWSHVAKAFWTGKEMRAHGAIWDEASSKLTPAIIGFALKIAVHSSRRIRDLFRALTYVMQLLPSKPARRHTMIPDGLYQDAATSEICGSSPWPKTKNEIWLLIQVVGLVSALRLLLCYFNVKKILKWLPPAHVPPIPERRILKKIVRYTDVFLGKVPFSSEGNCLPRSLALYYFATRCGLPVKFHCGVRKAGAQLKGHAWLTLDGEPFFENGSPERSYTVTFTFPVAETDEATV